MNVEAAAGWPARSSLPPLAELDASTLERVAEFVDRLRQAVPAYSERVLTLTRTHVPGYSVASDDDIRASARNSLEDLIAELSALRPPNDAARDRLEGLAQRRAAQGMPLETLSLGYRLGSREMLAMMDEIAEDVGLPYDLVLAMHDSTWEFANEAATVFARIEHDRAVERVQFDAERRTAFVRGILGGGYSVEDIHRDVHLFGLDTQRSYVALAISQPDAATANEVRRALAAALRSSPDRLLLADVGPVLGCIASAAPDNVEGFTLAVGGTGLLDSLSDEFEKAELALETASLFGIHGVVRLHDLGPKPLVLSVSVAAAELEQRYWSALDASGRSGHELAETTRVYLECDQRVDQAARRLRVHANTIRYRVTRFRDITGLDVRNTEDLVTVWWILNRQSARRG